MIITKELLNTKVSKDMFPTRLDSALNLYCNIKDKGIIVYNVNPNTWNVLYPFFELNHKFTIDNYNFKNTDITYQELIDEYQQIFNKYKYDKNQRKEILINEYLNTFKLKSAEISDELECIYELKFSKSKNVWTLYYFENYVVNNIDDVNKLLSQNIYSQEFISLSNKQDKINNIPIVENTVYLLTIDDNIKILNDNVVVYQ